MSGRVRQGGRKERQEMGVGPLEEEGGMVTRDKKNLFLRHFRVDAMTTKK